MKRYRSLDLIRGVGILGVVFLHSATFNYGRITEINFDNPPLVITVIGFLLMWGGLFAMISAAGYGYMAASRLQSAQASLGTIQRGLLLAGLFMLVLHYLYFLVFGPKLLDIPEGNHHYALLPGLIATGAWPAFSLERFYSTTALSMIAWNLILMAPILSWVFRLPKQRGYLVLGLIGTLVMLASLLRILLYPLTLELIQHNQWLSAIPLAFLFNKSYPVLPFLGFGFFGLLVGILLAREETGRIARVMAGLGVFWLLVGLAGLILTPDTMLRRDIDLYWYFLTLFQLGLFLLLLLLVLWIIDFKKIRWITDLSKPFRFLGTVSLTVFFLEAPLSQALSRLLSTLWPGWNAEMSNCLWFAGAMIALWLVASWFWFRWGSKLTLEQLTAALYARFGRSTGKSNVWRALD